MIKIPGYSIGEEIYNGPSTLIYRAKRDKDDNPVIIKLLKKEYPTPIELTHFQHEYEILTSINGAKGIVKTYDILDYWNSKAIVMEDIGGESLENLIKKTKINLKSFLVIAVKLCDIIESIHKNNIIHKDIKPQNILLNPQTGEVELIDFSISTRLLKDNQEIVEPGSLEGTLQYISPEQTGRMNRSIDYRTDFYSLGVTFYEMLTGKLPFDSNDPMELVHSHIAKIPVAPHMVKPEIPEVISRIILKLMSKNAEDRYQGTWGLKDDLTRCYKELKDGGTIPDFEIAKNDVSGRFQIPEKLYGREKEREQILTAFEKAASGEKQILFITGESGIGKTAIIHEVQRPIVEKHGFFISGKYDKFKRNIPYSAIIQAFQELVRQILTKDEEKQQEWKKKILDAVGSNGKLITEIIPQIELIIGEQQAVQELPPQEAQNRFNLVFQNFVKAFTGSDHPLVLFLDDLQWMDQASLNLIHVLFTDSELAYFLFFGSYRDNEVDEAHPLYLALDSMKKEGVGFEGLKITHLSADHIDTLIKDTLHLHNGDAKDLAGLTEQKTGGNPFFVIEFLKKLNEDSLISFNKKWIWNIDKIQAASITANVVELMADKIKKLPPDTLEVIKLSACIGVKTYINTLAIIYGKSEQETLKDLTPAINEGMIIKVEDDTKFVHDRVREAAYSLIDTNRTKELHHKIGTTLLNHPQIRPFEERVFSIVNQLILCKDMLNDEERKQLIELSITAGKKAKVNAAWDAACGFFGGVSELLKDDSWETDYQNTLGYYTEWAEAEYVATHFDKAEELFDVVIKNAKTLLDKIKVYINKILYLINCAKFKESIDIGISILKKLRFQIETPKSVNLFSLLLQIFKSNSLIKQNLAKLKTDKIEDLVKLPEDTNQKDIICIKLIMNLLTPSILAYPDLHFPYLGVWLVNFSLERGLSIVSSIGFTVLALLNVIALKNYPNANALSNLTLKLIEKYPDMYNRSFNEFSLATIINHWDKPARDSIKTFDSSIKAGYESGNFMYASYSLNQKMQRYLNTGHQLDFISDEMNKHYPLLLKMKQKDTFDYYNMCRQTILNLIDTKQSQEKIIGEFYNEDIEIPVLLKEKNTAKLNIYYHLKLSLLVFMGNFELGYKLLDTVIPCLNANPGFYQAVLLEFFVGIVILKNYTRQKKTKYNTLIKKILKKFKVYTTIMDVNYEHMYLLLLAEYSRILGKNEEAIAFYEQSITKSKENNYIHFQALATECIGEFFLSQNNKLTAQHFLFDARYLYEKWGANAKVVQMDNKYGELLEALFRKDSIESDNLSITKKITARINPTISTHAGGNFLDIGTIMKATHALSSEIEMKSLLTKMIGILIENAGAQKGILILNQNDSLLIEAVGNINNKSIEVLQSKTVENSDILSPAIVHYVAKTIENVVLDNAQVQGMYTNDEYIKKNKVLSILCAPILNKGKLVGILYLENNISTSAFTADRVEMLKILSTQAAISIENARLIESMKEKERLKQEMEIAEHIQTSLCPPLIPHNDFEIVAVMKPAEEVGGDYYDIVTDHNNQLWLAIGDVSGHGVTPGLIMMMAQTAFNSYMVDNQAFTPKNVITYINKILNMNIRDRLKEKHFMTMNLLKYMGDGTFLQSGSHLDIIIYRKKTKKCETIKTKGAYLGIIQDIASSLDDVEFTMELGDALFLYTDGIIESQNPDTELWGTERFINVIEKNADLDIKEIKDIIIKEALNWSGNKQDDDISLLILRRKGNK